MEGDITADPAAWLDLVRQFAQQHGVRLRVHEDRLPPTEPVQSVTTATVAWENRNTLNEIVVGPFTAFDALDIVAWQHTFTRRVLRWRLRRSRGRPWTCASRMRPDDSQSLEYALDWARRTLDAGVMTDEITVRTLAAYDRPLLRDRAVKGLQQIGAPFDVLPGTADLATADLSGYSLIVAGTGDDYDRALSATQALDRRGQAGEKVPRVVWYFSDYGWRRLDRKRPEWHKDLGSPRNLIWFGLSMRTVVRDLLLMQTPPEVIPW